MKPNTPDSVVLIPARMESARLPGKPLKDICGIPMIVHVAKRSQLCKSVGQVIVCTDSFEITKTCEKYDISVCLTKSSHQNGTERIAEAASDLGLHDQTIVIDVQGDEAFVQPRYIEPVIEFLGCSKYGCVVPFQIMEDRNNVNRVKLVTAGDRVIYMSRLDVPYCFGQFNEPLKKHLSVIGLKPALDVFASTSATPIELAERID